MTDISGPVVDDQGAVIGEIVEVHEGENGLVATFKLTAEYMEVVRERALVVSPAIKEYGFDASNEVFTDDGFPLGRVIRRRRNDGGIVIDPDWRGFGDAYRAMVDRAMPAIEKMYNFFPTKIDIPEYLKDPKDD